MPAELLPRFESLRTRKLHRFVTFDHHAIMETEEGWLHCKTGEVISEIVIRIKRVVRIQPEAKKVSFLIHSGYAVSRNQKFRSRIQCSGERFIDRPDRNRTWPAVLASRGSRRVGINGCSSWPCDSAHRASQGTQGPQPRAERRPIT